MRGTTIRVRGSHTCGSSRNVIYAEKVIYERDATRDRAARPLVIPPRANARGRDGARRRATCKQGAYCDVIYAQNDIYDG
jgi:hypothetical protein